MRYDFDAISHGMPDLLRTRGGLAAAGLLCFLVGFGIKAGMWPFGQLWLPAAHPAAPSPGERPVVRRHDQDRVSTA